MKRYGKVLMKAACMLAAAAAVYAFEITGGPLKVFTPNGDGDNDVFRVAYYNPYDASVGGSIYSISGRHVRDMERTVYPASSTGVLAWDGKDSSGADAPAGIYIYQVSVSGEESGYESGAVVLVR